MDIETLLQQPESKVLEFKKDLSSLPPILKTVVAFANTAGGVLIIGRAPDGSLSGIKDVLSAEEKLANAIADSIKPSMLPEIEIVTVKKKNLLVVQVAHWKGPFHLKKEGVPRGVYIRLGSTSRPAGPDLLAEMERSAANQCFDQQPITELKDKHIDYDHVKSIFAHKDKKISRQKLRSMGILVPSANGLAPSIGGLILFGSEMDRNRYVPDARVRCARFKGVDKVEFLDQYDVEGTILGAISAVEKFIKRNTRLRGKIEGTYRRDIPEYPKVAIREAIINALAHADYSLTSSGIQVAIYDDRLEILNPGMLPFGYTMENFISGVSRPRNRVVTRVFRELGIMEEWGSGYRRILAACEKEGYPIPKWEELGTTMRVTLYPYTGLPQREGGGLSERQTSIISLLSKHDRMSFRELKDKLEYPVSDRTLRYELSSLKKLGLIDREGKGPATRWVLTP